MPDRTILHRGPEIGRAQTAPWFRDASDFTMKNFTLGGDFANAFSLNDKYPDLVGKTWKEAEEWLRAERLKHTRKRCDVQDELDVIKVTFKALSSVLDWAEKPLVMERPAELQFKRMRKAFSENRVDLISGDFKKKAPTLEFEKEVFRHAEVFMVEHDWASAFETANLKNDVVRLPYDVCAFEFKFSGRAIVALATQFETDIVFAACVESEDTWLVTDGVRLVCYPEHQEGEDALGECMKTISRQILAVCVALDAEVARTEIKREPHKSEHGSNNYAVGRPYHVVRLANRGPRPLNPSEGESGHRMRLHFRRGHWRHLPNHKVWINWMLVGDPDLGFVDKHYRL